MMEIKETVEIRQMEAAELDQVSGGNAFWGGVLGYLIGKTLDNMFDGKSTFDHLMEMHGVDQKLKDAGVGR
jgi:hypothetical protein